MAKKVGDIVKDWGKDESAEDLRDIYAGMALQGWLATFGDNSFPENCDGIANNCFRMADAMLAARKSK